MPKIDLQHPAVPLDDAFLKLVTLPIQRTWYVVRADLSELDEGKLRMTKFEAIEATLDCDYLARYGREPKAVDAIDRACAQHGLEQTLKFLARHVAL